MLPAFHNTWPLATLLFAVPPVWKGFTKRDDCCTTRNTPHGRRSADNDVRPTLFLPDKKPEGWATKADTNPFVEESRMENKRRHKTNMRPCPRGTPCLSENVMTGLALCTGTGSTVD